jgi:hypothetical protein
MLRRILRSRTGKDVLDSVAVLGCSSLILFVGGLFAAYPIVSQWQMSAEIGLTLVVIYLPIAGAICAALATPRFLRIVRGLRGRR